MKKLTRSRTNKTFLGVLGGLGEYWGVDPTMVRLGFIVLVLVTGIVPGLVGYFIAAMVIPESTA